MTVVTKEMIETYQRDGVVLIKGLWKDWVEVIQQGIARNMAEPGPYASENLKPGEPGRFSSSGAPANGTAEDTDQAINQAALDSAYQRLRSARLLAPGQIVVIRRHRDLVVVSFMSPCSLDGRCKGGRAHVVYDPRISKVVHVLAED